MYIFMYASLLLITSYLHPNSLAQLTADPLFQGSCPNPDWILNPSHPSTNITINSTIHPCVTTNGVPPCYLFHVPVGTICPGAICTVSGCTGSQCSLYLTTNGSGQIPPPGYPRTSATPCVLYSYNFAGTECDVSCEFESGVCVSTVAYASTPDGIAQGINGSYRAAGTYCSNYAGKCDGNGNCVALQVDNPISALTGNLGSWISSNWQYILAGVGGLLLLIGLLHLTYRRKQVSQVSLNAIRRLMGRSTRRNHRNPALAAAARPGPDALNRRQGISRGGSCNRRGSYGPSCPMPSFYLSIR